MYSFSQLRESCMRGKKEKSSQTLVTEEAGGPDGPGKVKCFISDARFGGSESLWGFRSGSLGWFSSLSSFCTHHHPFLPGGFEMFFDLENSHQPSPRRWGLEGVTCRCALLCSNSH